MLPSHTTYKSFSFLPLSNFSNIAFHRFYTMTLSLMLLFCLVAVFNNLVTLTSARQLKNSSTEKEVNGGENGGDQVDPSKNTKAKMELNEKEVHGSDHGGAGQMDPSKNTKANMGLDDQKQLPFPFPFPFSPSVPEIPGFPMPTPLDGFPFPTPFDIPGIPPLPIPTIPMPPFPPVDIPGVVPSPPT